MMTGKKYLLLLMPVMLMTIVFSRCITPVEIPGTNPAPEIVVDGLITDQPGQYEVRITRTAAYSEGSDGVNLPVTAAAVFIRDDQGMEELLYEYQPGYYITPGSIRGIPGRSYTLEILLEDGTVIESYPEKMMPVPPVDSLFFEFQTLSPTELQGHRVYGVLNDPVDQINYYRWKWTGYYVFSTANAFAGYSCMSTETDINSINILEDRFVNGNTIIQPVAFIPHFGNVDYLVHIFQQSLTSDAYDFWIKVKDQDSQTGSIFDRIPSKIQGNLYYADGREESVYGYFGASAINQCNLMMRFRPGIPPAYPRTYEVRPCYTYPNTTDFLINDPDSWPEGWGDF